MHLRVETKSIKAAEALKVSLQQLQALSEHVLETFEVITYLIDVYQLLTIYFLGCS